MPLLDKLKDGLNKITPSKFGNSNSLGPSKSMSGGIGSGHGMVPFEDDMIVSKPAIIFHASQIFFNFLAMACMASVAAFQAKWSVGPSGLSGFAIFITVAGILLSSFMLAVPVVYEKYDKVVRLARALKEVRVGFILTGTGTGASLLIAFIVTISVFTQAGCKDASNDPHAEDGGDDFVAALPGWCSTKKAAAVFMWLAFAFWAASLVLLILQWRSGKLHTHAPRDPPFTHPETDGYDEDDVESSYQIVPPVNSDHDQNSYSNSNSHPDSFNRPTTTYTSNTSYSSQPNSQPDADTPANPFSDSNRSDRYAAPASSTYPSSPYSAPSRQSMDAYGAFDDPAPSGFGGASPGGARVPAIPPVIPEQNFGAEAGPRVSRTMQYADPYAAVRASIGGDSQASVPPSYESYQGYR